MFAFTEPEEENELREHEHETPAATDSTPAPAEPTTTTSAPTTVYRDPCAGDRPTDRPTILTDAMTMYLVDSELEYSYV